VQAAYQEGKILVRRECLEDAIVNEQYDLDVRTKLGIVDEVRKFVISRGLHAQKLFETYSHIDAQALSWIVMACKDDSFTQKTWWFPIVGSVPYVGFFDETDAIRKAEDLRDDGYETYVRGADAFSTLGWFRDPVVTPMLRHDEISLVNTIIHESVHATVWVPGSVEFNESLANFVALVESISFYSSHLKDTQKENSSQSILRSSLAASLSLEALHARLSEIFKLEVDRQTKLSLKAQTYASAAQDLGPTNPMAAALLNGNNARFMQVFIYFRRLDLFNDLFERCNRDLAAFLLAINAFIKQKPSKPGTSTDFLAFEAFVNHFPLVKN
jgi:predicted aminopeptidase